MPDIDIAKIVVPAVVITCVDVYNTITVELTNADISTVMKL